LKGYFFQFNFFKNFLAHGLNNRFYGNPFLKYLLTEIIWNHNNWGKVQDYKVQNWLDWVTVDEKAYSEG